MRPLIRIQTHAKGRVSARVQLSSKQPSKNDGMRTTLVLPCLLESTAELDLPPAREPRAIMVAHSDDMIRVAQSWLAKENAALPCVAIIAGSMIGPFAHQENRVLLLARGLI